MSVQFDPDVDGYTCSLLTDWVTCRQRASYKVRGWRKTRASDSATRGGIFHELLQAYYTGEELDDIKTIIRRVLGEKVSTTQQQETAKFLSRVLFDTYMQYWHKADRSKKWQGIESEFDVWFCGYRLRGKRDGLFLNKRGELWLLETKTKARIAEEDMLSALSYDFQNLFYITATERELRRRVSGVLYNIIRMPGNKQLKNETMIDYHNRVRELIKKDPKYYFMRYEITYPADVRARFEKELLDILNEIHAWVYHALPSYRNRMACMGAWTCQYLHACAGTTMEGYEQLDKIHPELGDYQNGD